MPFNTVLEDNLLPFGSVKLGRLVLNSKAPLDDFYDQPEIPEALCQEQQNFEQIQKNSKYSRLRARIARLFYLNQENRQEDAAYLTGSKAKTYTLENSGAWFKEACKTVETRKWLEAAITEGSDVYLVIGYHTIFDAHSHVREGVTVRQETRGANAGGEQAEAGFDTTRNAATKVQRTHVTLGEQIYAVQYRKLAFKAFSSRIPETLALERGNRWKVFWGLRGVEDTGEDDVVQADLTDELPEEPFEESCEVGDDNETFLF